MDKKAKHITVTDILEMRKKFWERMRIVCFGLYIINAVLVPIPLFFVTLICLIFLQIHIRLRFDKYKRALRWYKYEAQLEFIYEEQERNLHRLNDDSIYQDLINRQEDLWNEVFEDLYNRTDD